jgi:hypothetical protein
MGGSALGAGRLLEWLALVFIVPLLFLYYSSIIPLFLAAFCWIV